mmetsp:Transcript_11536/g.33983  ORF Transcript_11536/g.33983 Transcript_11536/m.33983 type:complete len:141 (+) Transcript_11536:2542-2964(+)
MGIVGADLDRRRRSLGGQGHQVITHPAPSHKGIPGGSGIDSRQSIGEGVHCRLGKGTSRQCAENRGQRRIWEAAARDAANGDGGRLPQFTEQKIPGRELWGGPGRAHTVLSAVAPSGFWRRDWGPLGHSTHQEVLGERVE